MNSEMTIPDPAVNQAPTKISTQALRQTVQPFTLIDKEQKDIDLPFVGTVKKGERFVHSFWVVHPTGRYKDDLILGRAYGLQALQFALGKEWAGFLQLVLNEFPRSKKSSGIERGFLDIVTDCALFGAMEYSRKMPV